MASSVPLILPDAPNTLKSPSMTSERTTFIHPSLEYDTEPVKWIENHIPAQDVNLCCKAAANDIAMMLAHETCCNLSLQEPNMKAHFKSLHKTLCKEYQDRYWHIAHNYRQGDTEPNEYFVAMMLLVSKRTQITDDVTRKHLFMNAANNAFYEYLLQEMPETFADMIEIALIEGRITRSLNERRQRDLAALQPRPENPLVASAIAVQAAQTPLTAPSDIGLVTGCQPARQLAHQAALTDAAADFISRFEKLSINDANTVMSILRAQLAGHNPAASHL